MSLMKAFPIVASGVNALADSALPALAGERRTPAPLLDAGLPGLTILAAGGGQLSGHAFLSSHSGLTT
jgi:hypothetical protein